MALDIDLAIVVSFLVINLGVGIYYGLNIKTLQYYAIGSRRFSTSTITATIIATWIGAGFFSSALSETYQNGLWHIVARFGDFLTMLIVGVIYAPRFGEFFGKISVGEIINELYGKPARIITAICSIALSIGYVTVQIKIFSSLFSHFFGMDSIYTVLISSLVIIVYSTFGGILSVTFTDKIQFFTFAVFVPIFTFFLWYIFGSFESISHTFATNPKFDFKTVFDYHNTNFYFSLVLLIYFTLPGLDPATIQRILMSKSTQQVAKSFTNAAVLCLFIGGMACVIGIITLSYNPDLDPNNLIPYVIDNYSYTGLKGFALISILAMGMSTSDSYINAGAVIFTNDFCKPLGINIINNDLLLSRLFSIFIGITAVFFAILSTNSNLFDLLLLAGNFYTPIITVPLTLAIFGFRSSEKAVLSGMFAGFLSVIAWRTYIQPHINIDSIIPGTIANLIILLATHYLLKEPGGWVGIKDPAPLNILKAQRKRKLHQLMRSIKNFNLLSFLKTNLPKQDIVYTLFGFFVIISSFSSVYTLSKESREAYPYAYNFIYNSVLMWAIYFLTYKIWSLKFKNETFFAIMWSLGIFYLMICVNAMLLIISGFADIQSMIFTLSLIITGLLLRWQFAVVMAIVGTLLTIQFFEWHSKSLSLPYQVTQINSKIIYCLLLFSTVLIAFIKPKQKYDALSEVITKDLEKRDRQQQKDLIKLFHYQVDFIQTLDTECIEIFKSMHEAAQNLRERLKHATSKEKIIKINEQLLEVTEKLANGSEYLTDIINQVKNSIALNITQVDIEQLVFDIIDKYNKSTRFEFLLDIKTQNKYIDCDYELIKYVIEEAIKQVLNSQESVIRIVIEDAIITYDLDFTNEYKKEIDGLKFTIINQQNPNNHNKVLISNNVSDKITKIIKVHYGKVNISDKALYSFIIPHRIKEVRPKAMDLINPIESSENLEKIAEMIRNSEDTKMLEIASKLLKLGLDEETISEITNLSKKKLVKT